jgi:hypothetical protein
MALQQQHRSSMLQRQQTHVASLPAAGRRPRTSGGSGFGIATSPPLRQHRARRCTLLVPAGNAPATQVVQTIDQAYNEQMAKQVRACGERRVRARRAGVLPRDRDEGLRALRPTSPPRASRNRTTPRQMGWTEPFSYHFDR